jgi:hypothetical protein
MQRAPLFYFKQIPCSLHSIYGSILLYYLCVLRSQIATLYSFSKKISIKFTPRGVDYSNERVEMSTGLLTAWVMTQRGTCQLRDEKNKSKFCARFETTLVRFCGLRFLVWSRTTKICVQSTTTLLCIIEVISS